MGIFHRIFKVKESGEQFNENLLTQAEQSELQPSSLREEILSQPGFEEYLQTIITERNCKIDDLSDNEIEALYEIWTEGKSKGADSSSLTAMGLGAVGALALFSAPAHANLGSQIAKGIVQTIEPFVRGLLNTAMGTLGVDISNGNDKVAIATGQGVDAQNEVLKSIYNKEAARASEPAPNECLSTEAAKRVASSEQSAKTDVDQWIVRDTNQYVYIRNSINRSIQRMAAMRRVQDDKIYGAYNVTPSAPPAQRIEALTKAASVTTFASSNNMDNTQRKNAEAHVAALFKDTAPKIDLSLEVDNPAARTVLDENVESEATLNQCKMVFERDIAERTGTDNRPSFRQAIAEKVASEYGSDAFAEEQRNITHAVPLLKTLVEQQAFANMMAVKSYEQQSELLKLQALQLKETVRQNLNA